ncbi:MAG: polysaccharide deacetylase family protein [Eubacterium sp.]|nr:polysaccharide deacetylase family protein [Eubacterium sp.]
MFVMTMTKRKLLRAITLLLVLITGAAIGVFAVLSSVDTKAETVKAPIYCVDRADNKISVTFDCAWENSNTDQLLAILEQADVKATFFVTGEFCDNYPEDVKKFYDAGHEIANHSDSHPHVKGMNVNDLIEDTKECSRKIEMITGEAPTLYRAPYGEYDDKSLTTLEGMELKVIQWNVDSIDWDQPSSETIIQRTTQNIASGSILLFHNDLENTTEALPKVLESLISQGFEPVRVSDLVYADNYTIDGTGKQIQLSESISTVVYSDDPDVNAAFEALAAGMTREDIDMIAAQGMSAEIAQRAETLLTQEQIDAIATLQFDELTELFAKLSAAVYARDGLSEDQVPDIAAPGEEYVPSGDGNGDANGDNNSDPIVAETDNGSGTTPPATTLPDKDGGVPAQTTTAPSTMDLDSASVPETAPAAESTLPESTSPESTESDAPESISNYGGVPIVIDPVVTVATTPQVIK